MEVVEDAHALNLTGARRAGSGDDLLLEHVPHPDQPLPDEDAFVRERAERTRRCSGHYGSERHWCSGATTDWAAAPP